MMSGSGVFRRKPIARPAVRAAASAALLCWSPTVYAQSINYGELEELFGEPVTTSVTGKPQRVSDAPAAITIITRDDIRRSPAHDIPGVLKAYAGIDVARWTAGQADVVIRGGVRPFDSRLLVMVNGRQVYLDHYGMTNWAGIGVQLSEIQQIEVVPGPNSALFGINAVSGVINIITVNPLHRQQLATAVEVGTRGYLRLSQSAALKLADWVGLRVSGGYERSNELAGLASSQLAFPGGVVFDPDHQEVSGEVYLNPSDQSQASLSATHTESHHIEIAEMPSAIDTRYRFTALSARASHDTGWGLLSLRMFRNDSEIEVATPFANLNFDNRVFSGSFEALVRAGSVDTLRAGLEYRRNVLRQTTFGNSATRYDLYAGSGMWEHQFGDAATFTAAIRVDSMRLSHETSDPPGGAGPPGGGPPGGGPPGVGPPGVGPPGGPAPPGGAGPPPGLGPPGGADYDASITEWGANAALLLKLGPADTLRIAASRGVQAPSLFSFGVAFPGQTGGGIRPAIIQSAEAGLTHEIEPIEGKAELTAFFNRTTDVISSTSNVGIFNAFGVTASLAGRAAPSWTWMLNYSWTRTDENIPANSGGVFVHALALERTTPAHKLKAQLSYEAGPWLATGAARYTSATRQLVSAGGVLNGALSLVPIDPTLALDAKLAFRINRHLTATVAGENLTGAGGVDLSPAAAERRLRAGLQLQF
ncbi:TonB-dependent receptor plug domain-containing protein [Sphingomonas qomolangmaensis]|uniref:TonB-dependent receptor n=1 Tax=Sphingomonas qomolangmaensis TaxID=2918765 RepID=A0ABY5LAQ4_9SPHN|nr:TonB-dependent receptor [Sphingomonas qomolangmaensis]UUL84040.1 TonB-dependent receptor [Sphingomonas qomolangmaensis]